MRLSKEHATALLSQYEEKLLELVLKLQSEEHDSDDCALTRKYLVTNLLQALQSIANEQEFLPEVIHPEDIRMIPQYLNMFVPTFPADKSTHLEPEELNSDPQRCLDVICDDPTYSNLFEQAIDRYHGDGMLHTLIAAISQRAAQSMSSSSHRVRMFDAVAPREVTPTHETLLITWLSALLAANRALNAGEWRSLEGTLSGWEYGRSRRDGALGLATTNLHIEINRETNQIKIMQKPGYAPILHTDPRYTQIMDDLIECINRPTLNHRY